MLKGRPDGCGVTTALLHGVDLWPTLSSSSAFALVGVNLLSLGLDGAPHEHLQDASYQDLTPCTRISCAHSATRLAENGRHLKRHSGSLRYAFSAPWTISL